MQEPGGTKTGSSPSLKVILLSGAFCAIIAAVIFTLFADRTPALHAELLENRLRKWRQAGPENYDLSLSIQVDGEEASLAAVSVRDGKLASQTYNGLPRQSADDSYTVAGLFKIMQRELQLAGQTRQKGETILKAEFDPSLAMPILFKRFTTAAQGRSCVIRVHELKTPEDGILFSISQPR